MNRDQAVEIHRHLTAAANALNRAGRVIFELEQKDRAAFAGPFGNVATALQYELLHKLIYRQFLI